MRVVRWFGKNLYYFSFAAVLLLTSSVAALSGGSFSFSVFPGGNEDEDSPVLIVQAEPLVQSAQTGPTTPPDVNPDQSYYVDENGNWIAGTAPPKPEPEPQTSSWCGEKKRKKWQDNRCQEIRCPDSVSGPHTDWYNPCEPCSSGLFQRVCADFGRYGERRDND